jgi:hypothetical protein
LRPTARSHPYAEELTAIVRIETEEPDARVIVLCVQQAWQDATAAMHQLFA